MITAGRLITTGGILGGLTAAAVLLVRYFSPDRPGKDYAPDALPQMPAQGKTGYRHVDEILGKLRAVAQSSGIPLGLLVGWIAKESGGKLSDTTRLDERGYFQLMPDESKTIGVDHQRLSTDSDYSIDAGVKLIRHYQSAVNNLDLMSAPAGTAYYWRLVKLGHSMGGGQLKKVIAAAKAAGAAGSWNDLEQFAIDMKINGPQPKKWFPFVDKVYEIGRPFGFGSGAEPAAAIVGLGSDLDLLDAEGV